ncbi:MAG: phage tail tape measure protein [Oscillospiraceae bacterium]|nr:phage tail tape measure protein [Oscillospiraceae bacterium]
MAVRTISTKLAIDGEAQYKKAISDCNGALSSLKSNLSLVESEFRNNANSMEALTAKSSALDAVYEKQKEKVSALEKALSNAQQHQAAYADLAAEAGEKVAEYSAELEKLKDSTEDTQQKQAELTAEIEKWGAVQADAENASRSAEKSVQEWQKQLNNAKIGLNDLSDEISRNNQYMAEAEDSADQCAQSIDSFGKEVKDAGEASERFGSQSSGAVEALAQALVAAGVTKGIQEITKALMECSDAAGNFEASIFKISTISDPSSASLDEMRSKILQISNDYNIAAKSIGESVYQAISSGVETEKAFASVEKAAKLAKGGFTSVETSVDVLTTALNAYKLSAAETTKVSDILITTQKKGKTSVDELANSVGKVIPLAASYNVQLDNLGTSYAILTANGVATAEAGTYLKSVFSELGDSGSKVASVLRDRTGKSFADLTKSGYSVGDVLALLGDSVDGSSTAFNELWSSTEAGIGALSILNSGVDQFNSFLKEIQDSAGATEAAYQKMAQGSEFASQRVANSADNLKIAIGEQLNPALTQLYNAGADAFNWAASFVEENPETVGAIVSVTTGIGALTAGLTLAATASQIAAAKQAVLNAVMSANPAYLLVASMTALAAAITAYSLTVERADADAKSFVRSLQESKDAYQELMDAMAGERSSVSDSIRALKELLAEEDKSAAQKEVILRIVDQLNQAVPDLGLAYDAASDSINMAADALERVAGAFEDQTENEAQIERLSELYEERSAITRELADAQAKLDEALANAQWDSFGGAMNDAAVDVEQLRSGMDALTSAQADNAAQIAALEEATAAYSQRQAESAAQTQEMTSQTEEISARTESLVAEIETLEAAYTESYNAAMESINGQMGLFQEMDGSAKTSIDSLIDTLKGQVAYMDSYSKNIQKAMELGVDEGLIRKLSDGSEKSAQILAAIVKGGTEDIAALNEQLSMVEKGKESFSGTVADMENEFDKKMETLVKDLQDAVKDMNLKDDAYKAGWNNIQGLIDGTNAQKGALTRKYAEMGKAALAAYKREVQQASPSKAFRETGKFDIQGLIGGAESMKDKLANMYAGIAKAAKKVMGENLPSFHLDSEIIPYDPSVDYSALMLEAKSRAEFDALATQREAKIAGEQIDLVEKGYLDNLQLLEQWKEAMAESEAKAQETLSFITEHVDSEMRQMIDGAPGMGQDFVNGLIEGIERDTELLIQSVQKLVSQMEEAFSSFQVDSEIISYDPSVDYSALMQKAKSRAEFDALAAQREAKIAGEQIDLVEKGYLDNLQLLEQWKEAMAESESKARETLSFITEHVDVEMRKMIDGAPGMGQDFVDGLIEGIERKSEALNQSVQRMVQDMKACIDAEFQPVQEHLSNLLTDLADKSGAMYREDRSAYMQDIASTLRDALDGLSVNMSQRKVGELVTSWQKNSARSLGV